MRKVTIVDVAKMAGVSVKTVSRVINNSPDVRENTRERVNEAMRQTGYQVNILAKGLKGTRTNIVVVFADRHQEEHLSAWHNIMLKHLFIYAKTIKVKIVLCPSNSENFVKDETDGFYLIANGIADGAILLENIDNDPRIAYFEEHQIPYVVFGQADRGSIPAVSLDNYDAGYNGGKYLMEKGYHKIALFIGEKRFRSTRLRILGFEDVMHRMGGEYQIYTGIDTIEKAYCRSLEVLDTQDVQAFFVNGDERALGVYRGIYEKGYRIPEDFAVLGIDNIPSGRFYYPPISTIGQDFKKMSENCLDYLEDQIVNGIDKVGRRKMEYPTTVIERQST